MASIFELEQANFGRATQGRVLLAGDSAHINNPLGGMGMNGKAEWLTQSKTVGNVTESYSIPDRILKSPYLSKLSKTTYGAQLLELVSPQLIGNFASFHRDTLP